VILQGFQRGQDLGSIMLQAQTNLKIKKLRLVGGVHDAGWGIVDIGEKGANKDVR